MKYFGTDGIRGIPYKTMTEKTISNTAKSIARYILSHNLEKKIIIAKDTRPSSDNIVENISTILMSSGIDVFFVGIAPSASVAYLTMLHQYDIGIMISASHNPVEYNGIKLFGADGAKLSSVIETEIDDGIDDDSEILDNHIGKYIQADDYLQEYIDYISQYIETDRYDCVIDAANGAATDIVTKIFGNVYGLKYISNANGVINDHCGCTMTERISTICRAEQKWGFAYDGDADRIHLISSRGKVYDGDAILYILAKANEDNGNIVGTIMSNFGLEKSLKNMGVSLVRERVGDKHIISRMKTENISLGGESSGHIIYKPYSNTGDGILISVLLMNIMSKYDIEEILDGYIIYPSILHNIELDEDTKHRLMNDNEFLDLIEILRMEMYDSGRIVLRESGTEPMVRIMVEAIDNSIVNDTMSKIMGFLVSAYNLSI